MIVVIIGYNRDTRISVHSTSLPWNYSKGICCDEGGAVRESIVDQPLDERKMCLLVWLCDLVIVRLGSQLQDPNAHISTKPITLTLHCDPSTPASKLWPCYAYYRFLPPRLIPAFELQEFVRTEQLEKLSIASENVRYEKCGTTYVAGNEGCMEESLWWSWRGRWLGNGNTDGCHNQYRAYLHRCEALPQRGGSFRRSDFSVTLFQ